MVNKFVQTILETQSNYRQIIQRKMKENGIDLSFEMLFVMKRLAESESVNQQELAISVYKDKSSLSYLIKSMEGRGLVTREEDQKDKRNKLVELTVLGRSILDEAASLVDEVYATIDKDVNQKHVQLCIHYMSEFNSVIKEN